MERALRQETQTVFLADLGCLATINHSIPLPNQYNWIRPSVQEGFLKVRSVPLDFNIFPKLILLEKKAIHQCHQTGDRLQRWIVWDLTNKKAIVTLFSVNYASLTENNDYQSFDLVITHICLNNLKNRRLSTCCINTV